MPIECKHCNGEIRQHWSRDFATTWLCCDGCDGCVWLCGTLWATTPCEQRRAVEAAEALLAVRS